MQNENIDDKIPTKTDNTGGHLLLFRVGNYCVLITFLVADRLFGIKVPDACYYMVVFAVLGGDVQALFYRFFKLR
jgi:hypothetical protein